MTNKARNPKSERTPRAIVHDALGLDGKVPSVLNDETRMTNKGRIPKSEYDWPEAERWFLVRDEVRSGSDEAVFPDGAVNSKSRKKYDLAERTAKLGEETLKFVRTVVRDNVTDPVVNQLVRSSTSVGANYMEADAAESKRDFRHKISVAKKEAQETMHWFRMLATAHPQSLLVCRQMWQEAHELTLIFGAILKRGSDE